MENHDIFQEKTPSLNSLSLYRNEKSNYIHFNPCQPHWNLTDVPENYKYSSAKFYETGIKNYAFLYTF